MHNETAPLRPITNELGITLNLLLSNVKTLLACTLVAIAVGFVYLAIAKPQLEFAARLLVSPEEGLEEPQRRLEPIRPAVDEGEDVSFPPGHVTVPGV